MPTPPWLCFADLAIGEPFRFMRGAGAVNYDGPVLTKTSRQWYVNSTTGRKYRTGAHTAISRRLIPTDTE